MVLPAAVVLHLLLFLGRTVALLNSPQVALHLAILKNLLTAKMFLL
jgi:hypothetical protein